MEVPSKAENAIELLYDPEVPLWGIYLEKTNSKRYTYSSVHSKLPLLPRLPHTIKQSGPCYTVGKTIEFSTLDPSLTVRVALVRLLNLP